MKSFNLIITLFFLSACSFHSSQLNMITSLVLEESNDGPVPNWTIEWADIRYKVYAINNENYIYFADYEDNFVEFDGWQISKVSGLLAFDVSIEIIIRESNMYFLENDSQIYNAKCQSWQRSSVNVDASLVYSQECVGYNPNESFTNIIVINDLGYIISLKYKIHPDYPPLAITMDDYFQAD